jgi:hypothetical protein
MARKPRLHALGGFYHVTLRGNDEAEIFFAKEGVWLALWAC